ncbi:MAG: antibiotic biosynthesis monooxygenase family protein [Planctomycetota bacterium]|nr:antibiotic biosynthesis monooxygenase family protein [Planctomycetota bacterium]
MPKLWILFVLLAAAGTAAVAARYVYVGYDFRGPGYDAERGRVVKSAGKRALVVITYGRVGEGRAGDFRERLKDVISSMDDQPGLIGFAARKRLWGDEVWTMSAWTGRDALEAFVYGGPHATAMASGAVTPPSFRSVELELDPAELPLDWDRAEALFDAQVREATP